MTEPDPAAFVAGLALGATLSEPPVRLTGGRSADLHRVRLATGPSDLLDRDLVLRIIPVRPRPPAESVIQSAVADLGFSTPRIHRIGQVEGRHGALMDHVDGTTLFDADRLGAFRRSAAALATLMADLHRLDPAPVTAALEAAGADWAADAQAATLVDIDHRLDALPDTYGRVRDWLEERRPAVPRSVVCHGDLHVLNVLVTDGRHTVIDWEGSIVGDPAHDVVRTTLIMSVVPMELPRLVRPALQRLGARLARRFARDYAARAGLDPASLAWHEVLHATRIAAVAHVARQDDDPDFGAFVAGWGAGSKVLHRRVLAHTGIELGAA